MKCETKIKIRYCFIIVHNMTPQHTKGETAIQTAVV